MSRAPCGAITVTCRSSAVSPNDSGSSPCCFSSAASSGATGTPNTSRAVITMNAIGWIGASVPGGSTGRWTPFSPPFWTNSRTLLKLPNFSWKWALLAPIGSGRPTCEMTTPISPAGTWTQGYLRTV
jgi:hypothetical protein